MRFGVWTMRAKGTCHVTLKAVQSHLASPEQRALLEVSFDTVGADGIRTGVFNPILAEGWTPPEGLVMPGAG